jgi:hypothetical protein
MANPFNTIHIFGFGTVQVITETQNVQADISLVQAQADACIDNVWANKPADYTGTKSYHAINTFYDMFSDWQPNVQGEQGYRVEYANLDSSLFEALASAVLALPVEPIQVEEPAQ